MGNSHAHQIQEKKPSCWRRFCCFWPCCKKTRFVEGEVHKEEVKDLAYWYKEHAELEAKMAESKTGAKFQEECFDDSIGHGGSVHGMDFSSLPPSYNAFVNDPITKQYAHAEKMIYELGGSLYS